MKRCLYILLGLVIGGSVLAENKTKLIVGITINQFYPEWLSIYREDLSDGGFKRLLKAGKEVTADYNYLYSQTGVDQTTIYTGLLPSSHGIVAHDWLERLSGKRENNTESKEHWEIGTEDSLRGHAPEHLQALSLGCMMKMNNAFSKVYSVGMNPEEVVLSGGNCADLALWFNEKSGKWVSSQYYADSLPAWVREYNDRLVSDFFVKRGWMPLAEEQDNSLLLKLKNKIGLGSSFYYDIAQAKRKFNTYRVLKATPYANSMVTDLAMAVIEETGLGKDNGVDLLALNYLSLDYMNRDFGLDAKEFQDMVMRLDKDMANLLEFLDTKVGRENYTIVLTFCEARELLPEDLEHMKIQGGYFSVFKAVALLKSYLNLIYGEGDWVMDYDAGQIYLNRELIEKNKLELREVQDRVAEFMAEFEGVGNVYTAYALARNSLAEGKGLLVQNSFSQKKSGDVLFTLLPAWVTELKDAEDNYFRYSKRNKVPVYLYGAGIKGELRKECRMTDILPTFCFLMGMPALYTLTGNSLFAD
ncbi:alkaline phosphatase family protein [Odoribacter lunatus]|uniref:alkaline phosphatase family protein n=1 Tax=Odoribacter lunatus TaxID=2941335 RepID=UPI00203A8E88|nr:alkaline phosphatase family protein [Odoribacter lunatus]